MLDVRRSEGRSAKDYNVPGRSECGALGKTEALCEYVEEYEYDLANRITRMKHRPTTASTMQSWDREYIYREPSQLESKIENNRLSCTRIRGVSEYYKYEGQAGRTSCITRMPGMTLLQWDYQDRLHASSTQIDLEGDPEITYYVNDYTGARVRKVTERSSSGGQRGTRLKETIMLADFQIHRCFRGDGRTLVTEKKISHVTGSGRIALIENAHLAKQPVSNLQRYQFGGAFELDDTGALISWLQYTPFGASAYVACRADVDAPSVYRYSSYEQDSDTGLYCCGARYYASWLGRWISPDPLGIVDGFERYAYAGNDPVNFEDHGGTMIEPKNLAQPNQPSQAKPVIGSSDRDRSIFVNRFRIRGTSVTTHLAA